MPFAHKNRFFFDLIYSWHDDCPLKLQDTKIVSKTFSKLTNKGRNYERN